MRVVLVVTAAAYDAGHSPPTTSSLRPSEPRVGDISVLERSTPTSAGWSDGLGAGSAIVHSLDSGTHRRPNQGRRERTGKTKTALQIRLHDTARLPAITRQEPFHFIRYRIGDSLPCDARRTHFSPADKRRQEHDAGHLGSSASSDAALPQPPRSAVRMLRAPQQMMVASVLSPHV